MQCFICMTYMVFLCNAIPVKDQELRTQQERRSLFSDVIESLRIRSQLPEDDNQSGENNLSQNYDTLRYNYDSELPRLPSDAEYIPRRNDRIAMPSMKYRFPKSFLDKNETKYTEVTERPIEEFVLYIETTKEGKTTTSKPKKMQKKPVVVNNKIKGQITYKGEDVKKNEETSEATETTSEKSSSTLSVVNSLAGQSQIGNRESQIVVKPTVIVNFRGTVSHRDSDIKLEGRKSEVNGTRFDIPQNIFNINQEIKLERTFFEMGSRGGPKKDIMRKPIEDVTIKETVKANMEEGDMMMCETATWKSEEKVRERSRFGKVFEILFKI